MVITICYCNAAVMNTGNKVAYKFHHTNVIFGMRHQNTVLYFYKTKCIGSSSDYLCNQ